MIKETIHEKVKVHNNFKFFLRYGQPRYLGMLCTFQFNNVYNNHFEIPRNDMDNSSVATI